MERRQHRITEDDVMWIHPGSSTGTAAPPTPRWFIAIQTFVDGRPVDWLEHVTDDQYLA